MAASRAPAVLAASAASAAHRPSTGRQLGPRMRRRVQQQQQQPSRPPSPCCRSRAAAVQCLDPGPPPRQLLQALGLATRQPASLMPSPAGCSHCNTLLLLPPRRSCRRVPLLLQHPSTAAGWPWLLRPLLLEWPLAAPWLRGASSRRCPRPLQAVATSRAPAAEKMRRRRSHRRCQ